MSLIVPGNPASPQRMARGPLTARTKAYKSHKAMNEKREVTRGDVADGLGTLGIVRRDLLLVHSSLSSFGHVEGGADAVIDALLEAVGEEGTVVVPTHTWDRVGAGNPTFDVRGTPSGVGRITEVFRRRPQAHRGLHPTHSCAALGPLKRELMEGHETQVTPCGSKSPYQRAMELGGKIVFLGVTLRVNTSFHALEEIACVPWLFDRFELLYVLDEEGSRRRVPCRRHTDGLDRCFEEMEPILLRHGAMQKGRIGGAAVRVVEAGAMRDLLVPMLAEDPFMFLEASHGRAERRRYEEAREERRRGR